MSRQRVCMRCGLAQQRRQFPSEWDDGMMTAWALHAVGSVCRSVAAMVVLCLMIDQNLCILLYFFFLYMFLAFSWFSPLSPLTGVSPQPSAIPGGNPPEDWQSAVGWGGAGYEPGTAGQQSDVLPLSHHAFSLMFLLWRPVLAHRMHLCTTAASSHAYVQCTGYWGI
jgi:hypothetical protein